MKIGAANSWMIQNTLSKPLGVEELVDVLGWDF